MQDWSRFVNQWEHVIRDGLSRLPEEMMSAAEQQVLRVGLALPGTKVELGRVSELLVASGLRPDGDHLDFLASVGGINLIAMGADDGILLPASDIASLKKAAPSIYAAWNDGARMTSMGQYLATAYVDAPVGMLPLEVIESAIAISTAAGGLIHAAAPLGDGDGNDYLRLDCHGDSVRYSSFEEFIVTEREIMLESFRDSIEERLS